MKSYMLDLNSIERVKGFVNAIESFEGYFDLASGRYVIDAKSIMGIFSMDLSNLEFWRPTIRFLKWRRRLRRIWYRNNRRT